MFHGPRFQMITSLDRTGREGIDGTLEVKPRHVVPIQPGAANRHRPGAPTDAAMHILGGGTSNSLTGPAASCCPSA